MISYFDALFKIFNSLNKHILYLQSNKKNLVNTLNNIAFEKIIATHDLPLFKNSAMDGYCVHSKQTEGYSNKNFKITGSLNAGKNITYKKQDSSVVFEIMTGARIPSSFDAVIKLEDVHIRQQSFIIINKKVKKNENIRKPGEDFKKNNIILKKGDVLNPGTITCLSAFGIKKINVVKDPNVFLLSTGNEIASKKYKTREPHLINNSTYAYITSFFKSISSLKVKYLGIIKDDVNLFLNNLKVILSVKYYTLFITTGAVSKGTHDFIPLILRKLGIRILVHYVNIKPGKPILIAKYKKHMYFFCLPGNPISSIIGLRFFIFPFLNYFYNQKMELPILAKLNKKIKIKIKKDTFLKGFYNFKNSIILVEILKNQESFKIKPLLYSNCFIFIKNDAIIQSNKRVNIYFNKPIIT